MSPRLPDGKRFAHGYRRGVSESSGPAPILYTIGHGARSLEAFLELLERERIERVVDVRSFPGSRKHPHFGKDTLAASLAERSIEYVWRKDLGGFRKAKPDSRHTALRSAGFRGYADHMETEEFRKARDWLIQTSREKRTAFMCAESLWWRCHRRMLADALVAARCDVRHIMDRGLDPHDVHPAARIENGLPTYNVAET